jgi:hypothetical protein
MKPFFPTLKKKYIFIFWTIHQFLPKKNDFVLLEKKV